MRPQDEEKQVNLKFGLDTKTENNLMFWRTRKIKNLRTKSCVPKHKLQTR